MLSIGLLIDYLNKLKENDFYIWSMSMNKDCFDLEIYDYYLGDYFAELYRQDFILYNDGFYEDDDGYIWASSLMAQINFKENHKLIDHTDYVDYVFDVSIVEEETGNVLASKENCESFSEVKELFRYVVKNFGSDKEF